MSYKNFIYRMHALRLLPTSDTANERNIHAASRDDTSYYGGAFRHFLAGSLRRRSWSLDNRYSNMASLDLAGIIGTWVAAFVAIIALIGVIGPTLVWRASRTERHQALVAVGGSNSGFISRGIRAGPSIWLRQRVRAPILHRAPRALNEGFVIQPDAISEATASSASWVDFSLLLKAHGVGFSVGDKLVIRHARTLLPVHRLWILAVGLRGRYSERKDRGKFGPSNRIVRIPLKKGKRAKTFDDRDEGVSLSTAAEDRRFNHRSPGPRHGFTVSLYGVTGNLVAHLRTQEDVTSVLQFQLASRRELCAIEPDTLPFKQIFMFASGFMPLFGSRYLSLAETSLDDNAESISGSEDLREHNVEHEYHATHRQQLATRRIYRLQRDEEYPVQALADAYQLFPASEQETDVDELTRPFEVDQQSIQVLAPVRSGKSLASLFRHYDNMTYVPAESQWVVVPEDEALSRRVYLRREDAQALALSLLGLPWHPESYLLGAPSHAIGVRLLTRSASRLVSISSRISEGISRLGLGNEEQIKLKDALEPALRKLERHVPPDRTTAALCYRLDQALGSFAQIRERELIEKVIGILMITNLEYQELFYQSLRHLQQITLSSVQVDLEAATVKVPSAFGVLQTFFLDFDQLFPGTSRNPELVNVQYSTIVLASLKACLRSQMLSDCFNAEPLMGMIQDCTDVVHVK